MEADRGDHFLIERATVSIETISLSTAVCRNDFSIFNSFVCCEMKILHFERTKVRQLKKHLGSLKSKAGSPFLVFDQIRHLPFLNIEALSVVVEDAES
jgi:hypothetical protein